MNENNHRSTSLEDRDPKNNAQMVVDIPSIDTLLLSLSSIRCFGWMDRDAALIGCIPTDCFMLEESKREEGSLRGGTSST